MNRTIIRIENGFFWVEENRNLTDIEIAEYLDFFSKTQYQRDRLTEYQKLNQFEMQYNDLINGTTTWIDAINDIKAKYPKPE